MNITSSIILIASDIEEILRQLLSSLPKHFTKVIKNEDDNKKEFLQMHSRQAIKEAYLASNKTKYIILCGSTFRIEAQNTLLKVLEEPPKNKYFILITESKSSILPTIKSRLPITVLHDNKNREIFKLDIDNLNLTKVYKFVQENNRLSSIEC